MEWNKWEKNEFTKLHNSTQITKLSKTVFILKRQCIKTWKWLNHNLLATSTVKMKYWNKNVVPLNKFIIKWEPYL